MKLKGLAKVKADLERLQGLVDDKIDALDSGGPQYDAKAMLYDDAWSALDASLEGVNDVIEMKLEDYL